MRWRATLEQLMTVEPGTPGGRLLRRYWHPVALGEELPPDSLPLRLEILSEALVLFRDGRGRLGLLARHCIHCGADLSRGPVEGAGIRCPGHGSVYDVQGQLVAGARAVGPQPSYLAREAGGLVFGYLGPRPAPPFPDLEPFRVPEGHRFANKMQLACHWLQANEGNLDPAHVSFLHRALRPVDRRPVPGAEISADVLYSEDMRPSIELEPTAAGFRIWAIRRRADGAQYVRTTEFLLPNAAAIVGNEGRIGEGYSIHWHVPIDRERHWRFELTFNRQRPLDRTRYLAERAREIGPDWRLYRRPENRYGQDRVAMRTETFSGIGRYFPAQDAFATETQGAVVDHAREHLGYTDKAIIAARRLLVEAYRALEAGTWRPPDLSQIRVLSVVVPAGTAWRAAWQAGGVHSAGEEGRETPFEPALRRKNAGGDSMEPPRR